MSRLDLMVTVMAFRGATYTNTQWAEHYGEGMPNMTLDRVCWLEEGMIEAKARP